METNPKKNKEEQKEKGLIDKAKELANKLPSLSFSKADPQDPSGKRRLRGIWLTWRF
jgi:hypothetical protein